MELEGLKRGLEFLVQSRVPLRSITTDRHLMIAKFLRENYEWLLHYYDEWHFVRCEY